jgi:hypothetical protein
MAGGSSRRLANSGVLQKQLSMAYIRPCRRAPPGIENIDEFGFVLPKMARIHFK